MTRSKQRGPSRVPGHAPRSAPENLWGAGLGPLRAKLGGSGTDKGCLPPALSHAPLPPLPSLRVLSTSPDLSSPAPGRGPGPLLCIPHPLLGFPGISSALIPGASKPGAGGGGYFRNRGTGLCNCVPPFTERRALRSLPTYFQISISQSLGPWALEFEKRDVL